MADSRRTAAERRDSEPAPLPDAAESGVVRIRLLGRFEVSIGSRIIREDGWRLRKAVSLVKIVALSPGYRLHREQLMDLLWPDQGPEAAANNLHQALYVARRTLEPEAPAPSYLCRQGEQIALCPDGSLRVDVEAFEEAAAEARRARDPAAYRAALELYTGDLLPADRYEDWTEGRRERLRRLYLALLFELAELHEERKEFGAAVEALRRVVSREPAHEEAHVALMRLYAITGQRYQALKQYERLRHALHQELGTEPGAVTQCTYEEIVAGHVPSVEPPAGSPPVEPPDAGKHNLPGSLTSFVGREREKEEVKRLLGMVRLLTLTGTGGCGKTRLAQEVARDLAGAYPDGAWLVELAPLADPTLIPQAVARTLGIREQPDRALTDALVNALCEKKLLLILDNCEHLVDACAHLVETLLSSCPPLRILATSREPLGAAGEVTWQVPPLSGPGPQRLPTVENLEGYESVRLFVERARYRNPAFVLTPQNAWAVAEICERLNGIPLAVELAAARVGMSVEQIAARLGKSLRLLTGGNRTATPRQRTLRGALDWSYDLLSEPERKLFGRLSVFAGGWTLEAAEAVASGGGIEEDDVLNLLSRLVDKSLVAAGAIREGGVRYRMLEPIRQYAREKLEGSGESDAARHRHAGWCLAFVERADAGQQGTDQASWVEWLERERANAQAALGWALEAEPETALRLAAPLGQFWYRYGPILEGRRWLEAALERTGHLESAARARALRLAGVLSEESGLYDRAQELHEQGLALYRRLGDRKGVATSLTSLGALAYALGDLEQAVSLTEESLSLKQELGDEKGLMSSRNNLAEMLQTAGDLAGAQALFEENLSSDRIWGDEWGAAVSLLNLGTLAVEQEEPLRAQTLLLDALRVFVRLGDEDAVAECLTSLAGAAGTQGEGGRAARLLGAAEAAREDLGTPIRPVERDRYERFVALSRRGLADKAWPAAWAAGRAMPLQQAAEYALSTEPVLDTPDVLTRREREVAALVAQGLTNRHISNELSISERTVDTHVARILKKLGIGSRERVAARLAEQHPLTPDR